MIIRTKFCPKNAIAWVFFGLILTPRATLSPQVINHERIHCRQQLETLYIPFYLWYGIEWFIKFIKYRDWNEAYYNISFEREAYANGDNLNYLKKRKPYAFLKYLIIKK